MKSLATVRTVHTKLTHKITDLEAEELKMLRLEMISKERWVSEFKEAIEGEKAELADEIARLREHNRATQQK